MLWLSDVKLLRGTLFLAMAIFPATGLPHVWMNILTWEVPAIQTATFNTVIFFLHLIGQTAVSEPENSVIGIDSFRVSVAASCSGIAGIGMVSAVMAVYILAFRERLKFGLALMLIPLAAGISWVLNSMRIAALLMIGAYVSPELAVQGFHTFAGWLAFCASIRPDALRS